MNQDRLVYLRPNVVLEPLIDRWYAWSHLISPATFAMNLIGRHLKIMSSFIQSPLIHEAAIRNPKLKGGPFMDIPAAKAKEVANLKAFMLDKRADLMEFANAILSLDKLLKAHPKGYSLNGLYARVPEILKGYVELIYDLNNNASFRFFEKLLYNSPYYQDDMQSIALWLTNNDERPFVLSTPRIDSDDVIHLQKKFDDVFIDNLSRMKRKPAALNTIKSMVTFKDAKEELLFESLFCENPPPAYQPYTGDKARMRYFGHACILVEFNNISILVDPLVSYYGYESSIDHYSDFDLPDTIDYVLITHNHQDHILFETLLQLRHRIGHIIVPRCNGSSLQDPDLKMMFNTLGFNNIIEIDEFEAIKCKEGVITGIPFMGEHSDLNIKSKMCYHLQIKDFSILFAADSCNIEPQLYKHVHALTGDVNVIFLGMECDGAPLSWLYGPLMLTEVSRENDNSRRLAGSNYQQGMDLIDVFNPDEVYVYAMGQEPWLEFISSIKYTDSSNPIIASNRLIDDCTNRGIISERLYGEKEILYSYSFA
jgi:L-ascorbate metabolism protein UlaG (beta-lactamase superfamily)